VPGNFTGAVVLASDGSALPTQACGPLVNAAQVLGNIALVDRGTCAFVDKVRNAQAAGAIGVLIANNAAGSFVPGGTGPDITIPTLGITLASGNLFKANAAGLAVSLAVSDTLLAGADTQGRVLLYAPTTRAPGSTYSHFDTRVTPNALMEPFNTASIRANVSVDLTTALFADEGWPIASGNARLGGCDTGVPLQEEGGLVVGASVEAHSRVCRIGARNHGQYVSCMVAFAQQLRDAGLVPGASVGGITSCAARNR
jgi:hypothetical protein